MYPTLEQLMRSHYFFVNGYELRRELIDMVNDGSATIVDSFWEQHQNSFKNKYPKTYGLPKLDAVSWSRIDLTFLNITTIKIEYMAKRGTCSFDDYEKNATWTLEIRKESWLNKFYQGWIQDYVISEEANQEVQRRAAILANLLYNVSQQLMVPVNPNFDPSEHIESI